MRKRLVCGLLVLMAITLCSCGKKVEVVSSVEKDMQDAYDKGYEDGYANGKRETESNYEYKMKELEGAAEESDSKETTIVYNQTDCDGTMHVKQVTFSGAFTATVGSLSPDYCALEGKPIAIVHFFQDYPFMLSFSQDMTGLLEEGQTYVFEFEPFTVEVAAKETDSVGIEDYSYKIKVTSFKPAEDGETGMRSIMPEVSIE